MKSRKRKITGIAALNQMLAVMSTVNWLSAKLRVNHKVEDVTLRGRVAGRRVTTTIKIVEFPLDQIDENS